MNTTAIITHMFKLLHSYRVLRKKGRDSLFQEKFKVELIGLLGRNVRYCESITKAGIYCSRPLKDPNQKYCFQHGGTASKSKVKKARSICKSLKVNGEPCKKTVDEHHDYCSHHAKFAHMLGDRPRHRSFIEKEKDLQGDVETSIKKTTKRRKDKKSKKTKEKSGNNKDDINMHPYKTTIETVDEDYSIEGESADVKDEVGLAAMFSSKKDKKACRELLKLREIADSNSSYVVQAKEEKSKRVNALLSQLKSLNSDSTTAPSKEKLRERHIIVLELQEARREMNAADRLYEIWLLDINSLIESANTGVIPHEEIQELKKCMATGLTPFGDPYVKFDISSIN